MQLRRNWNSSVVALVVAIVCMVAIGGLQIPQLRQLRATDETPPLDQVRREVATSTVNLTLLQQMPTFGFNNLLADAVFLQFLQYFGDTPARQQTDYRLSPDYFEVILKHDPYFIAAYTFLSTSSALYAGLPERSVAIMERGLASLKPNVPPGSFWGWRQLAIDQLLFLGDSQSARRSFETAADWASQSSVPGSDQAAALSRQTATFLATNPNSKFAQFTAWAMVLGTAPDDRTRQTAVDRIETLGGQIVKNPDGTFRIIPPATD